MGIRGSGGGSAAAPGLLQFLPQSFTTPPTNGAPLAPVNGTNVDTYARAFDDTTEEYVQGSFRVPASLDTSGTVTFEVAVMAKTAAASKNVAHRFGHLALADGEDFDQAYTNEDSGDKAIAATQDDISIHSWTETVANLGWVAGDMVQFRYSRVATSGTNLSGDMYLLGLTIKMPAA